MDFSRWGVFAPKDSTGFGRMADDMISVLGVGYRLIADSFHMTSAPPAGGSEIAISKSADRAEIEAQLALIGSIEGVFFFERLDWNLTFFRMCRERGIRTVCVPMWEWFRVDRHVPWELVDLFVCPNHFAEEVVKRYGFRNVIKLPWCLDLSRLRPRSITGPARVFVHNAGLVDIQDRKGTRDTIQAFKRVKRDDIQLIVRMQREAELPELDQRTTVRIGNLADPGALYAEGDVAIQPSKMEGIGFMVLEPVICGMPVITLDYPPMNEWVRQSAMLVKKKLFRRRAFPSAWVRHAHLRLPSIRDLARKIEWCSRHDLTAIARQNREWAEQTFDGQSLRKAWVIALSTLAYRTNVLGSTRTGRHGKCGVEGDIGGSA